MSCSLFGVVLYYTPKKKKKINHVTGTNNNNIFMVLFQSITTIEKLTVSQASKVTIDNINLPIYL